MWPVMLPRIRHLGAARIRSERQLPSMILAKTAWNSNLPADFPPRRIWFYRPSGSPTPPPQSQFGHQLPSIGYAFSVALAKNPFLVGPVGLSDPTNTSRDCTASRPILSRIAANNCHGTATSAKWNVTYLKCRMTGTQKNCKVIIVFDLPMPTNVCLNLRWRDRSRIEAGEEIPAFTSDNGTVGRTHFMIGPDGCNRTTGPTDRV
jgi:hypothetical protein